MMFGLFSVGMKVFASSIRLRTSHFLTGWSSVRHHGKTEPFVIISMSDQGVSRAVLLLEALGKNAFCCLFNLQQATPFLGSQLLSPSFEPTSG